MKRMLAMRPMGLPDLHRHLDGSLRLATLQELARDQGVALPDQDLRFSAGMGLEAALARFALTLSVLQNPAAVCRVAAEICEDAAQEGVDTLEIRFAPQLHRAAAVEAIVDAAVEGAAGRAGIVLCGLYGEPPEVLERLVAVGAARAGVVGIDLAGGPSSHARFGLVDYQEPFARARDLGLGRTVHAGEGRPAAEIATAVERLFAQRIGHGTTLLDDPRVVELVIERGVTLEACPSSNVHTGVIARLEEHPLAQWLLQGVRACVCTDNTLFSDVDSPREHQHAASLPGMTPALLEHAIACGHEAAFSRSR